jgi:hypothetical protein
MMRRIALLAASACSRATSTFAFLTIGVFAVCPLAFGQIFAGGPSLLDSPIQFDGGSAVSVKSRAVHFGATVGGPRVFGAASFEQRERTDTDRKVDEIRIRMGWNLNGSKTDRLQLCPVAEFSHFKLGGRDWAPWETSVTAIGGALLLSKVIAEAGAVRIVPTVTLVARLASDGVGSAPDGYGRFGVSFIVSRWFAVHPTFRIPAAIDVPEFAIAVGATVGIAKP